MAVVIRNKEGFMINEVRKNESKTFPLDYYSIELPAPIKLYLIVESELSIGVKSEGVTISFEEPVEVYLGARSHHERPAATITTTENPTDMMKAVSSFSSAFKTMSCERSYPTLRGHPPKIEIAENLQIPDIIETPETGIKIEVPTDYTSIYTMSPLIYYLGASVIPGGTPSIKTIHGFEYNLRNMDCCLEVAVEKILKQCFFFDCIVRTDGYYKVNLHEREKVTDDVDLDFTSLYDDPVSEQIRKYLSIPHDNIKTYLPQWKQTAYIECTAKNIETLPFLLYDLAVIRSGDDIKINETISDDPRNDLASQNVNEVGEFSRDSSQSEFIRGSVETDEVTRTNIDEFEEPDEYVNIPETTSFEEVWIGSGIPIGANKATKRAFHNRLERSPIDGDIDITVVVNDEQMAEEGVIVDDIYGSREQLSFSVNVYQRLTVEELHNLLEKQTDFFHYIGHIDEHGFECVDGQLEVKDIDNAGADTFLLNACSSYQQAIGLIEAGSIAGIATLKPVLNSGAERVGKAIARLLNLGFPLIAALKLAQDQSIMGDNYVVIGDSGLNLTQPKSGIPSACEITNCDESYDLSYKTYLTRKRNLGTMTIPFVKNNKKYFLASGQTGMFELTINDLLRFLSEEELPVQKDSKLYWSDEISVGDLMK
jgi:hypothetical protein